MDILVSNSRASYYVGGTEVVVLKQSLELARLGHNVVEMVRSSDETSEYFDEFTQTVQNENLPITIEEIDIDAQKGNGSDWNLWNSEALDFGRRALPSYVRHIQDGIGMCASHMVTDSVFIPSNVPSVLHLHGHPVESDRLIEAAMLMNGPNMVAHSDSILDWWQSRFGRKTYDTFRNGVDTSEYTGNPRDQRNIDVLYVGRFLEHKGIQDILDSITPDTRAVIAGSGPYLEQIQELIRDKGLASTELIVKPTNSELRQLYSDAKIFACPSRGKEGVLTTMLEAAASGCTILTTTGTGMTDLIRDNYNGRLVAPADTIEMIRVIDELLTDDAKRIELADSVQGEIRRDWSWSAKGKQLERIYENIING